MTGNYYSLLQERLKKTGCIPLNAPFFRGYCDGHSLQSDFGVITTGSQPLINPTSYLCFAHNFGGISARTGWMSVAEIDPCSCFSIKKNTCISTVFLPVWFFQSNLWQKDIFSQTGLFLPISARWPCLLIVRRRVLCLSNTAEFVFSDRQAESTHTHTYQTLSKTFSAPLIHSSSYWYMHISMNVIHWYWYWYCSIFANFKIFCAQSESLICCSSPVNPKRASSEFQILIYRSLAINGTGQVSEHNNACFNALPPLRLTFQRHSPVFWYSMPWLQVLSNTKSVILGSQSTIKSIIVPLTNMGYLCSLKNPKLLYILRHSSVN